MKNCQESLELLYDILDKQATDIDTKEVKEHLETCQECLQKYELEESVHKFLNARCQGMDTACCVDKLKSKIQTRLDNIDCDKDAKEEPRPFFRRTTGLIAAAAAVIVLITAGFVGNGFYHHYKTYIPLEQAHWDAAKNTEAFEDGQVTFATLKDVYDNHQYAMNTDMLGYVLIGARREKVNDVPLVHFVYQNETNDVVSVFLASANNIPIPDDLQETEVIRDGVKLYDHNCRGCRLIYQHVNDMIIVTATENHEVDLLSFKPGVGTI